MDVSLQGRLTSFKLADVLTLLHSTRKTGTLQLDWEGRAAAVYLRDGVIYATTNQEHLRLGALLVRLGKIEAQQRAEIEIEMEQSGRKFGEIALERRLLTEEQLGDFLKIQASEIIFDCFVWSGGEFSFVDALGLPEYAVTFSLDLGNLIMEGARRIQEWEQCRQLLPDPDVILRLRPNPGAEGKITLSLEEWKILFLINGQRSLDEICRLTGGSKLQVYRLIYGLLVNKLIEIYTPEPVDDDDVTGGKPSTDTSTTFRQDSTHLVPPPDDGRGYEGDEDGTVNVTPAGSSDHELLISPDARHAYKDVVSTLVARLSLVQETEEDTRISWPLSDHEYRIGRLSQNEIQLFDLGVSGSHARVYRGQEGYFVEDLHSRNGTWVNGVRIFTRLLQENDKIRVGSTELVYNIL